MLAQFVLQMNAVDAEPARPAIFGIGCCITPFIMLAATVWVIARWPKYAGGHFIVGGLLLVFPFLGLVLREVAGQDFFVEMIGATVGHALWIALFVYAAVQIRRAEVEEPPVPLPVRRRTEPEPEIPAETRYEGDVPQELLTSGVPPDTPMVVRCKTSLMI